MRTGLDVVVATWDIQRAVHKHIKPFLNKFPLEVRITLSIIKV